MKKAMQFIVIAALAVSLSGCTNTNQPQTIQESLGIEALTSEMDEKAVPEKAPNDSFSESKTSSEDGVIAVKAEAESSLAETLQPTVEPNPATVPLKPLLQTSANTMRAI